MALVTITIEDQPDGTVKVVATPNFATMAQMDASGHSLTSAHGYAMRALNSIREAAREQSNTLGIIIPRIGH